MRKVDKWTFEYKGVKCEVNLHSVGESYRPEGTYCGYLIILKKQLPRTFKKLLVSSYKPKTYRSDRRYWDYWKLEDYFDMHCGITYYELLRDDFTGEPIGVKVGCDYAHLWDEGRFYTENTVKNDLERSVDKFISKFPNYLVWRSKDGKYVKPSTLEVENA